MARYYSELIRPTEVETRKVKGVEYIVSQQFLNTSEYKVQRGYYDNDSGDKNNSRLTTKLNKCEKSGLHWVSVMSLHNIQTDSEVCIPYGKSFKWT